MMPVLGVKERRRARPRVERVIEIPIVAVVRVVVQQADGTRAQEHCGALGSTLDYKHGCSRRYIVVAAALEC